MQNILRTIYAQRPPCWGECSRRVAPTTQTHTHSPRHCLPCFHRIVKLVHICSCVHVLCWVCASKHRWWLMELQHKPLSGWCEWRAETMQRYPAGEHIIFEKPSIAKYTTSTIHWQETNKLQAKPHHCLLPREVCWKVKCWDAACRTRSVAERVVIPCDLFIQWILSVCIFTKIGVGIQYY